MGTARHKVLLLTEGLVIGGAERQLSLLARYLPPDWEPRVWSLSDGPFAPVLRSAGTVVYIRQRVHRYDLGPALHLSRLLWDWRPSVVHSWGGLCSAIAAPMCRLLRVPWIDGTIRSGRVGPRNVTRTRVAMALADRVVANSMAGLEAWGVSPPKGRVIYNGFDPDRLPTLPRVGQSGGVFTATMVARMSNDKDFLSLIQAARLLTQGGADKTWCFQLVGSGLQRRQLADSAADLVEEGVMTLRDPGLEVLPHLLASDVGILMTNPSRHEEGCSNAIMEYMACGLPVVCSDSGGNRELVVDGETGFIVPPLDYGALATRIAWLRQHPDIAFQMGRAGRERILDRFGVEEMVRGMVSVYEEIIS